MNVKSFSTGNNRGFEWF